MQIDSDYIIELLQSGHLISDQDLKNAWKKVADSEGKLDIIMALKSQGCVRDDQILAMLAREYNMELVDISSYKIPGEIIDLISKDIVKKYNVLPIMKKNDILTIAMSDPSDIATLDLLRFMLKCHIEAVISPKEQISKLIEHYYGSVGESVDSFLQTMSDTEVEATITTDGEEDKKSDLDDAPIIKLVSLLIIEAYKKHASDIHLEPLEKKFRVRYRIDGVLNEVENPPKYLQSNIISRIKIMAKLDIAEKRVPQDGRIQIKVMGKDIDLRVSSIPSSHGESIVMRILDKSSVLIDIPSLGFSADDNKLIQEIITMPDGVFLVTGPTGSGKTTSLYAFLSSLNKPTKKIITVEDPVEYQLSGINQVQVNATVGMTFEKALRAMMRQAPNIIMVGEIRDVETADIAINASLTGHLVLSTLHTNDAPSAITRLIDIGVKPFLVASSVKAIMAQRLVRKVCKNCAQSYSPTEAELASMGLNIDFFKDAKLLRGKGCTECHGTGYKGRIGIYEIFILNEIIQHLIYQSSSSNAIKEHALKSGMRTLRDDGLRKAMAGITTLEEVIRITTAN